MRLWISGGRVRREARLGGAGLGVKVEVEVDIFGVMEWVMVRMLEGNEGEMSRQNLVFFFFGRRYICALAAAYLIQL